MAHLIRKMASIVILVCLASVLPGGQAASGLQTEGSFTVALPAEPQSLDPAATTDTGSLRVSIQVYDTLVGYQPGGSLPVPGLAESWSVSTNGLIWIFNLRSGLRFHDGTSLDAAAVKFNLERWWDPAHPHYVDTGFFNSFFGGPKGSPASLIDSVAVAGSEHVVIGLRKPAASLLARLAYPAFGIASPAAVQAGNLAGAPVGSGLYRFVAWSAGVIHLEANPAPWGEAPLFQDLYFRTLPNAGDRLAALQAGQVQLADGLPDDLLETAQDDPDLWVAWRPSSAIGYLGINTGHPPFNIPLVRQAIAHAINIQALVNNFYGLRDQRATQLLPPGQWGRDEATAGYDYNPDLARAMLEEAGYLNGFATDLSLREVYRIYLPRPSIVAQVIQSDLSAIGIDTQITVWEPGVFLERYTSGDLDLFLLGWLADYLHPENYFSGILCAGHLSFGPQDEALCGQVRSAEGQADTNSQIPIYQEASRRVHDTLQLLPLVHPRSGVVLRRTAPALLFSPLGFERFASGWVPAGTRVYLPLTPR
jgi:peptide/nickel transport system substrate-binding protein